MKARKIAMAIGLLALLAFAVVFPQVDADPTQTNVAVFTLIFMGAVVGWNILAGYTGYISLGHVAFFGISSYALALICQHWNIPGGYIPFFLVPVAGLISAVIAIPVGWLILRVRRHTFIVITIAMFFIAQLLAYNLNGLTNGSTGLEFPIPFDWLGAFYNIPFYYAALIVVILAIAISWWVRHSKFGLGLLAIRDDEDRAMGLGVKTGPSKLAAFVIAAFIVGMMGAIWGYYIESIFPASVFDPNFDIAIALMAFLGGVGTISGPILGALILEPVQQFILTQESFRDYYPVIYGALFLIVILLLPRGIIPTTRDYLYKVRVARTRRVVQPEDIVVTALPGQGGVEKKEGINL
jgi:branched-chain amino acid transport system permease protein